MKSGNPPKGSTLLNQITKNRVPKRHKKIVKKAIAQANKEWKPMPDRVREGLEKTHKILRERAAAEKANPELKKIRLEEAAKKKAEKEAAKPESAFEPGSDDEVLNAKERKLRDMLFRVVENFGGEKTITAMAKKSDALKVVLLKELLKIESKEMEVRLRSKLTPQGQGGQSFLFVIAGLNDVKKAEAAGVDMRHLGNVLTPSEPLAIDIGEDNEIEEPEP